MFDRVARTALKPSLERAARWLARRGVGADAVSVAGLCLGLLAALLITRANYGLALMFLLASRVADGLDGPVARLTTPTDRGAFIDITFDFLFYASIPLAFAIADPAANALPAAVLLASFIGTGASFLAFAVMAERRGLTAGDQPRKGLFYLGGLTEGSETLLCFVLMCLWPGQFALWAYGFAVLCGITIVSRIVGGARALSDRPVSR
jgi:phosphatidylglycerophosphate synthase